MNDFLDYCKQAEADYEAGRRDVPLIWEQNGDHVVDQINGVQFLLAEALLAVTDTKLDNMGDGVLIWFGPVNVRISFGTRGNG